MVCVVESNKEIKKRKLRLYRVWIFIASALKFFKSEVWELIKFQSSLLNIFFHLISLPLIRLRYAPNTYNTLHQSLVCTLPRPPLMTCAFYAKTVIQNPLCRLMFTLCHCLDRNLLLRIRFAFKICLRHQSVTPILDPSLTVTDISSRNGCSYYW